MIKTILVPATGNQTDDAVFTSALAAARAFNAHLDFLHIRVDAAAMVAAMATDGSGAAMVSGLVERIDEEATRREDTARQLFQRFCERERLAIEDTPAGQQSPTAQWLRQIGDEAYWVREYGRAADLLVVGHPADDQGVSIDTIEAALVGTGRPVLIVPAAPLVSLPETIVIAWKAAPEAARAVTAAMPLLSKAKQIQIVTVAEEQGLSDEEGARLMTSSRLGMVSTCRPVTCGPTGWAPPTPCSRPLPKKAPWSSWAPMATADCANGCSAALPSTCCAAPRCRC